MTTTTPAPFRLPRTLAWAAAALAAFLFAGTAAAQQPPHDGREPPPPPPEAYAACKDQAEGACVTLSMPDGRKLQGTCRTMNGTLVAMPAGGPPGAGGPPPAR